MNRCKHGLTLGTCSLCLGIPQSGGKNERIPAGMRRLLSEDGDIKPREKAPFSSLIMCKQCGRKFKYPYRRCLEHLKRKDF